MLNERLIPTKRRNPCPLCEDTTGDCRTKGEIVLCHSNIDGLTDHPLFHYVRPSKDGIWGVFIPRVDRNANHAEIARQRLIYQQRRQELLEQQAREYANGLTRQERDASIRRLAKVGLLTRHREQLRARGLTDEQIAESLFFSITPHMEVPVGVSEKLPGVKQGKLCTRKTGYACVAFDHAGLAIGFQIRDENPTTDNKYTWARGTFPSHLQTGELPLSVAGTIGNSVLLCEGLMKPRIASYRLGGLRVVGASGGHFQPLQLKAAIGSCRRIIICPDAGDITNHHVTARWERVIAMFNYNYRVQIAWWGQLRKNEHLDIDQRDNWDNVTFLTVPQWRMMVAEYSSNAESKPTLSVVQ